MMLTFVVDAREDDVIGVTCLLHAALARFWGGVLGCHGDVRCGCWRR